MLCVCRFPCLQLRYFNYGSDDNLQTLTDTPLINRHDIKIMWWICKHCVYSGACFHYCKVWKYTNTQWCQIIHECTSEKFRAFNHLSVSFVLNYCSSMILCKCEWSICHRLYRSVLKMRNYSFCLSGQTTVKQMITQAEYMCICGWLLLCFFGGKILPAKYLLCSTEKRKKTKLYMFGMMWGWVNDEIVT